ncbi:hypothetical protein A9174_12745 [Mesorhizobium loti NZP2037]|nr:CBS domain-containing protein [Mesorhizobium loti]ANN57541.1 hypothetical protein A9174_12745 [Mesorhizobium loti NZP2037]
MKQELAAIFEDLKAGRNVAPITARTFLSWFGAQRRGGWVVSQIRSELARTGIHTVPDFESCWLDSLIEFQLVNEVPVEHEVEPQAAGDDPNHPVEEQVNWVRRDPTYRISKLAAANGGVVSINPGALISEAVTVMLSRDFSQLPVMTNERELKGIVSWKSIGARLALGYGGLEVRHHMETACEVGSTSSIFDAIGLIVQYDYVLVRGTGNKITGIITATDLSLQFLLLTEPFLLLSEIENMIRNIISERFSTKQLLSIREPGSKSREINGVSDLTFGEYIRLLEHPERWSSLGLQIDRSLFCSDLDKVRKIRNDVTHFDPDGITPADLDTLRKFTGFLKQLQAIRGV